MDRYGEIIEKLSSLGTVPEESAESFLAQLHRIQPVVQETLEQKGFDSAFIRSATLQFGKSLAAVYRYSLWGALAAEALAIARGLSARGGEGRFEVLLKWWIMGIISAVPPPELYDLVRPLELLRDRADYFESAAEFDENPDELEHDREFTSCILAGETAEGSERAMAEYRRAGSLDSVPGKLFYPSLAEIGRRWRDNIIGIAEEHAATSSLRAVARSFFGSISPLEKHSLSLLVACVPGDEHELGPEIISLYLSAIGWNVFFVGRSLPESDILRELERNRYDAAVLSVSMIGHLPSFENIAGRIREEYPGVFILAGGGASAYGAEVMNRVADAVAASPDQAHRVLLGMENADA